MQASRTAVAALVMVACVFSSPAGEGMAPSPAFAPPAPPPPPLPPGAIHVLGSPAMRTYCLVGDLAFSADDSEVVSVDCQARVERWDTRTGALRFSFGPPAETTAGNRHALSDDASILAASQCADRMKAGPRYVVLWDAETGKKLKQFDDVPAGINSMAVSHDHAFVATADADEAARIWDAATGKVAMVLTRQALGFPVASGAPPASASMSRAGSGPGISHDSTRASAVGSVLPIFDMPPEFHEEYDVSFSPDGKLLGTCHAEGEVLVRTIPDGKVVFKLDGIPWGPAPVFFPDGRTLAVATNKGIVLVDLASSSSAAPDPPLLLHVPSFGYFDQFLSIAISPDGRSLAGGTSDGAVYLWDLEGGGSPAAILAHSDRVEALAFSHDGKLLASAGRDSTIGLWKVSTATDALGLVRHFGWITDTAFSPDGKLFATAGADARIHVWSVSTGMLAASLYSKQSFKRVWMDDAIEFTHDGKLLWSASTEGDLVAWKAGTWEEAFRFDNPTVAADLAISPDGSTLAIVDAWGSATLVDAKSGKAIRALDSSNPSWGYYYVRYLEDGSRLVISGMDSVLRVWDPSNGKLVQETTLDHNVYQLGVIPGSTDLAIRCYLTLHIYGRSESGIWKQVSSSPAASDVAFSHDGRLLAVPDGDRIDLFLRKTGKKAATVGPAAPGVGLGSPLFSPDDTVLASITAGAASVLWAVP